MRLSYNYRKCLGNGNDFYVQPNEVDTYIEDIHISILSIRDIEARFVNIKATYLYYMNQKAMRCRGYEGYHLDGIKCMYCSRED